MIMVFFFFFFFKQKTAYEVSVRDWSSDVCSSDLRRVLRASQQAQRTPRVVPHVRRGRSEGVGPRSEERRVGKECERLCRSRGGPAQKKKKQDNHPTRGTSRRALAHSADREL